MTKHERDQQEAQRILTGSKCRRCGDYGAEIQYEAGCTYITCDHCGASVAAPDAETTTALELWAKLT